jgi:quercetin dioxygenase-like cupin family protein
LRQLWDARLRTLLIFVTLLTFAGSTPAEEAMHDMPLTPDALTWRDHPNIPKGGQVTILVGDPTNTGEIVVQRLKLPPNYRVPPHIHPYTEYGTVISGSFGAGVGKQFERTGDLLRPGSFWMHPAKHPHFGWTGNEGAIVQIHFIGPGGIEYVNLADDPGLRALSAYSPDAPPTAEPGGEREPAS